MDSLVPVAVSHFRVYQHLFHYPDVLDIFLHISSVAPSQWNLSSEHTLGRIASVWQHPCPIHYILQVALATQVPAGPKMQWKGRVKVQDRGRLVVEEPRRTVAGLLLRTLRWRHRTQPAAVALLG